MEIWQKIPEFLNYEINPQGRVRNCRTKKETKPVAYTGNYHYVTLYSQRKLFTKRVHRLVWAAFNGPIPKKLTVNHKDLNKHNNALSNLELLTQKENDLHAKNNGVEINRHKLSKKQISAIRKHPGTCREIGKLFNISFSSVAKIRCGKLHRASFFR